MAAPCQCTPSSVVTPTCPTGNCLKVPNITIDPLTSVLPCGGTFSVDFGTLSDLSFCTTGIVWTVISYDNTIFTGVSINAAGVLTGTTTAEAANHVSEFFEIVVKAMCVDTILSVQRTLKIPIKNACLTTVCVEGFHCNPCTGGCIANVPDLILT